MKKVIFVLLTLAAVSSVSVSAATIPVNFSLQGDIVGVNPRVIPVKVEGRCYYTESAPVQQQPSQQQGGGIVSTLLGGLAGGALGSQVGSGRGKTVATVLGTMAGSAVGNRVGDAYGNNNVGGQSSNPSQRYCDAPTSENRSDGYDVMVNVQGQQMVFRTATDPRGNFNNASYGSGSIYGNQQQQGKVLINFRGNATLQ